MKVEEAVEHMTTFYLRRIVDSFTKDFPRPEEDRAREIIVQNADELTDPARIEKTLDLSNRPYESRVLFRGILEALLNRPERQATEEELVESTRTREETILAAADDSASLKYEDDHALEVLREVLAVAIEDREVSRDELSLIYRLRRKLGVQERSKQVLLAQLGHFPRAGNEVHSPSEISDALNELQKLGVVFYCNRLDGGLYLIPEEIAAGVKQALGIEISDRPWRLLLRNLTVADLTTVLQAHGLPKYPGERRKEDQVEWIVRAGIQPSDALGALTFEQLYDVLSDLAGANVSGSKDEKIERIISYFENLVIKELPEEASPAERYYEYFVELAHRDRESLLANDVISKDRDMDAAFEEAARYLIEERFGLQHIGQAGSDHADGALELKSGDILMWDTKSKEDIYSFPRSHLRQFKRYIRDSERRVSCFLIIAPDVHEEAVPTAELLKSQSGDDTDVALIAAEELKWLAESWRSLTNASAFNPEVFDSTGILTRSKLEQRADLFL